MKNLIGWLLKELAKPVLASIGVGLVPWLILFGDWGRTSLFGSHALPGWYVALVISLFLFTLLVMLHARVNIPRPQAIRKNTIFPWRTTIGFPRGEPWLYITDGQLPRYDAYVKECRRGTTQTGRPRRAPRPRP